MPALNAVSRGDGTGFVERTVGDQRYVVFVPAGEPPPSGWPVVLFLHGAGERGTENQRHLEAGIGPGVRRRGDTFPGLVVFPQADFADGPILETWSAGEPAGDSARSVLADVERNWPVDPSRRSITGWSMGAYGALSLAAAEPDIWSKVLAISGGGEPDWGGPLASCSVWLIHGVDDRIVPVSESRRLAQAISSVAGPAAVGRLTSSEVDGAGHDLWRTVYDTQAVLDWLLADASVPPPVASLTAPRAAEEAAASSNGEEQPFDPVLMISRAISVRLGNDALETLAAGVPAAMPDEGLTGTLPPVSDEVEFDGRTFAVRFNGLSYQGQIARAILRGHGPDRLRMEFALRDFTILMQTIEVSDRTDGVVAGPVSVVIGHREPVWLKLEVRPVATPTGRLKLALLRSRFEIPGHNWYVRPPEQIDVRGDLFSEAVVQTAIVGGVYQRRALIEDKVLDAIEPMLRQVEARVDFAPLGKLVTALWPLPVYQPRVQARLEETSTDAGGVSLVFGCAVEAIDDRPFDDARPDGARSRREPIEHVMASGPAAHQLAQSTDLRAAVAVDTVEHLSTLVAGRELVQLYAADVPGRPFEELDDPTAVEAARGTVDSGGSFDDVRTRFVLTEPFRIVPAPRDTAAPFGVRMMIEVPRLSLTTFGKRRAAAQSPAEAEPEVPPAAGAAEAVGSRGGVGLIPEDSIAVAGINSNPEGGRGRADGKWIVIGEQDVVIRQPVRLAGFPRLDAATELDIAWDSDFTISATGGAATGGHTLGNLFERGWKRWAEAQETQRSTLSDLVVGSAALRVQQFAWRDDNLTARFLPAATVLVNRTDRPVRYCIRTDASRWSEAYTLPPETQHVYRTGGTLHVRGTARWSATGQPLAPGHFHWSPEADANGFHWIE